MDLDAAFRVFVRVAETESFTVAAKQLGAGQPAISKQVSALEEHLGTRLLHRTTRSITLTDEGREFLGLARHAIDAADYAVERAKRVKTSVSGVIRLSCHSNFARLKVVPRLADILEAHPDLDIELLLQDTWPNLVEQGIDLRIHLGEIEDETVIAQEIGKSPIRLFASSEYLERNGTPQTPADLDKHRIIQLIGPVRQKRWHFAKDGHQTSLDLKGRLGVNSNDVLWEAVIRGVGMTIGPEWMKSEAAAMNGMLIPVLADYDMGHESLSVAFPSRHFVPQKVRLFIDYLKDGYREYQAENPACEAC